MRRILTVSTLKRLQQSQRFLNIKKVVLLTTNPLKETEYRQNFSLYGVDVERMNPTTLTEKEYKNLLETKNVIALLKDTTSLYKKDTKIMAEVQHLELVDNHTFLEVLTLNEEKKIVSKKYEHTTSGFLDFEKKKPPVVGVFGWDDIFTVLVTGRTYLEMDESGGKISSRDMVISNYIKDRFYYKRRLDLNFEPQQLESSVDFSKSVLSYIQNHNLFSNPVAKDFKLFNMFVEVCNRGVVWKSSKNRREKNYFSTVVNPAIPLVAKKDRIHQATFIAHDIGHFYILEPLFSGHENTELQKLVYIIFRMISEAATMVLADVLFVESLKRSGFEYEWSARKIHPLYSKSSLDIDRDGIVQTMKVLMDANVDYCCKGNDTKWKSLVPEDTFITFKNKFEAFFIEDYRWNVENYENMTKRSKTMRVWWDSIKTLRKLSPDVNLFSIDDVINMMVKRLPKDVHEIPKDQIVDLVWKSMWEEIIVPMFEKDVVEPLPNDRRLYNTFLRYMIGQFALFAEHEHIPETLLYRSKLKQFLYEKSITKSITVKEINNAIKFFGAYVDLLQSKNLISHDDCLTFKEIYPLFEPCYVFYDESKDFYPTLESVYLETFNFKDITKN